MPRSPTGSSMPRLASSACASRRRTSNSVALASSRKGDRRGRLLVVSGPSGSGKSTICRRLMEDPRVVFSVSATTRKMRPGEVDGREYRFMDKQTFRRHIERGDFIEWAEVHGNLYGTPRAPMERALDE